jgi:Uma2 family endonuclease
MAAPPKTLLSIEEYMGLPDDGMIYEFDHGELISISRPGKQHGQLVSSLLELFYLFLHGKSLGKILAETGFQLEPEVIRGPDIAFVTNEWLAKQPEGGTWFQGAPDLAIEVISPSNTAEEIQQKITEYFNSGAKAAWVFYPKSRSVNVHHGNSVQVLGVKDQLQEPDLLPGLTIPIGPLFE